MANIFGKTQRGDEIEKLSIGSSELSVSILTLGAILQDVRLAGVDHSLTLGSEDLAAYEGPMNYFGALVGPVANRISNATAQIAGEMFEFDANENGETTLHGGATGTHAQVWQVAEKGRDFVELHLVLADGVGGFPANRTVSVRYQVVGTALTMCVTATSDGATMLNFANHSYWNLDGTTGTGGHVMQADADRFTPVDARLIPTGVLPVAGTPFDFRAGQVIGTDAADRIDHNLCLSDGKEDLRKVATLTGGSGVSMTLETTEVGLQVYDAEHVDAAGFLGHHGAPYGAHSGIAMEAQGWPDAPNRADFPPVSLGAGETYQQITRWIFAA